MNSHVEGDTVALIEQRIRDECALRTKAGDLITDIGDLEDHHCRYVIGEVGKGRPASWCGRRKAAGVSYCDAHVKICFEPPSVAPRQAGRRHARDRRHSAIVAREGELV